MKAGNHCRIIISVSLSTHVHVCLSILIVKSVSISDVLHYALGKVRILIFVFTTLFFFCELLYSYSITIRNALRYLVY